MSVASYLVMPNAANFFAQIRANARIARRMVTVDSRLDKTVTICGAGPSLADAMIPATDEVWACNSALPYLMDRGDRVTHGFCIDQGEAMLTREEWGRCFAVHYLLASAVSPRLARHLRGRQRTFFHSYLGLADPQGWTRPDPETSYEMHLYRTQFPASVQVGYGLNSVPRAMCLALVMGFREIVVMGGDCAAAPDQPPMPDYGTSAYAAWLSALPMYADGRTAGQAYGPTARMAEAVIDGVRWHTREDMVVSAQHMLDLVVSHAPRIRLVGRGLPQVFAQQGPEFFATLPKMTGHGVIENFAAA